MGGYDSPQHKLDARTVMKMSVITCSIHVADVDKSACKESHGRHLPGLVNFAVELMVLSFNFPARKVKLLGGNVRGNSNYILSTVSKR